MVKRWALLLLLLPLLSGYVHGRGPTNWCVRDVWTLPIAAHVHQHAVAPGQLLTTPQGSWSHPTNSGCFQWSPTSGNTLLEWRYVCSFTANWEISYQNTPTVYAGFANEFHYRWAVKSTTPVTTGDVIGNGIVIRSEPAAGYEILYGIVRTDTVLNPNDYLGIIGSDAYGAAINVFASRVVFQQVDGCQGR